MECFYSCVLEVHKPCVEFCYETVRLQTLDAYIKGYSNDKQLWLCLVYEHPVKVQFKTDCKTFSNYTCAQTPNVWSGEIVDETVRIHFNVSVCQA